MLKTTVLFLTLIVMVPIFGSFAKAEGNTEISVDQAIKAATKEAVKYKYDTSKADIEILKVKKGFLKEAI